MSAIDDPLEETAPYGLDDPEGILKYELRDGTAWIYLNRPEAMNSFSSELYGLLKLAIRRGEHDDSIDTIVITGTGQTFGTGGDLKEILEILRDGNDKLGLYRFEDNMPFA